MSLLPLSPLAYLACAGALAALTVHSLALSGTAVGRRLVVLLGASSLWCGAYGCELLARDPHAMREFVEVAYLGVAFTPAAWALSVLHQARRRRAAARIEAALWTEASLVALAALTNDAHGGVWTEFVPTVVSSGAAELSLLKTERGPVFWAHAAFAYSACFATAGALAWRLGRRPPHDRAELRVLLVSMLPVLLTTALYMSPRALRPVLDLSPIAFGANGLVVLWAVRRAGLGAIGPTAAGIALRASEDPVFTLDRRGRLIDANRATLALMAGGAEALGRHHADAFGAHPELAHWLASEARSETELHVELEGRVGHYVARVHEVRSGRGRREGEIVVMTDVTALHEAALQLHVAETRHRAILGMAPDSILVMDEEGRVVDLNPAAERTVGLPRAAILGRSGGDFLPRGVLARMLQQLERDPAAVRWHEAECLRSDGTGFPAEVALTRLTESGRRLTVGYVRDVSDRHQGERLKDEILATVSHEMRTPLAAVVGFSELLLERDVAPERARRMLGAMATEAGRLARLIDDLLDLKGLQAGAAGLRLVPVDLGALIRDVSERLPPRHAGVELSLDVPALPRLSADASRIEQVIVNLLSNALKFSPPDGRVEISMRSRGGERVVSVADRGPGIPAGDEQRVFQPFYRASSARRLPGTGLGLALVRQIVEDHGGRVFAERRSDGGARVGFALPEAPAAAGAEDPAGAAGRAPPG